MRELLQCCGRRKEHQCAHCGAEVDVHRAKALLLFGIILRFCHQDCCRAFLDAWRVIRQHQPGLVIGLGGYSSGPVMALAALQNVPTLLLEQNAVPGVTNRLLSSLVQGAAVSYEAALPHFGSVGFVTGNPVRSEFFEIPAQRAKLIQPRVLVLGGSQGAHQINLALEF